MLANSPISKVTFTEQGIVLSSDYLEGDNKPDIGKWKYEEHCAQTNTVYILGGGHVGLALSQVLFNIDFLI